MSDKNTGGPAFPCDWDYIDSNREAANGMTLRDYFAAKAIQAMLANTDFSIQYAKTGELAMAHNAYELADAMLKARGE